MKKDRIIRGTHSEGNFATIKRNCLMNPELTEPGFRLLMCLLNNSDEWVINTTFYQHELKWSPGKMAAAKKNLIELGHLKELKKFTGKGAEYQYTIIECPIEKSDEKETSPKVDFQELNISNKISDDAFQKLATNNTNIEEKKREEIKKEEINELKCSVTSKIEKSESVEGITDSSTLNTTPQLKKEDFFFGFGERPNQDKVLQYVTEKRGYSTEVGIEVYQALLSCDFKNQSGEPIKGIQRYIDMILTDKPHTSNSGTNALNIESFIESVGPINSVYVRNSIKDFPELEIYKTNHLLDMKDAAKSYFKTISRNKQDYVKYILAFIEKNNGKHSPASAFKKYVFKHNDRLIGGSGTDYFNRAR